MTIPTPYQLWASTNRFRDEGGPGMPSGMTVPPSVTSTTDTFSNFYWNMAHATAILGWHGLMWLHNVGYFTETCDRQKADRWDADDFHHLHDVRFRVKVDKYDEIGSTEFQTVVEGPTMLDAINAAIGAVLDAREGK